MVAIRCRFCFFLQFFFFLFSILFADPVYQVRVNQPGMLVIEVSLDTLWVDEQHVIHTRPALSQIHEPGFPQIPHTGDVLFGLPADVELQVMSGPVITLPIESVKITPGEQAKGIDYEMIPPSWDGEFYPQDQRYLRSSEYFFSVWLNLSFRSIISMTEFNEAK